MALPGASIKAAMALRGEPALLSSLRGIPDEQFYAR
jgi:hypothetical protein